jgi:Carboxypeptidase regulatory-like domain
MKFFACPAQRFLPSLSKIVMGILSVSFLLLFASQQLFSQGNAGRILGSVTDQSGGAVVGAMVTIVDTQRNLTRTVMTDAAGEYNVPNLLPSTYTVSAAVQGFKTAERSGVTLEVNQDLRVDLTLQPGEQTEKVTVTGELPIVETTNAELGGTIQAQIIDNLPLNGRNFENLLQLRPGVTLWVQPEPPG